MSDNQPEDVLALQALAARYAAGVDRRDRELFLSAFHAEATLRIFHKGPDGEEVISTRTGHEEIGVIPSVISRYEKTFHFLGNHLCRITGDEAEGEVYCTARHLSLGIHGGLDFIMLIRYQDQYRRDPDQNWLIADRLVLVDWTELHAAFNPSGS
jgi:hypothetical protein